MPSRVQQAPEASSGCEVALEAVADAPLTFCVTEDSAGARLDAYLASHVRGISRSRLARLIADGEVFISGTPRLKPSYRLRHGDEIELDVPEPPPIGVAPEEIPLNIVFEDGHLLVINKPAGLVVHPAAGVRSGTLANALAFHFEQLRNGLRPGIVHRLDRETSGLLVIAKTASAHEALANQFQAREVFKSYIALVHGRVASDEGRVDQSILRDAIKRTRMTVAAGGRTALTLYRVVARLKNFTLITAEIKTGRTHQIRVHMAHLKHPVVGDKVYGGGRERNLRPGALRDFARTIDRHFLHAKQLGFKHPETGAAMRFEAPLPDDMVNFLDKISLLEADASRI